VKTLKFCGSTIALAALSVLALNGCASEYKVGDYVPTQRQNLCAELKSEITFNKYDQNMNVDTLNPTQKAKLMQEYRKSNCGKLEEKNN
jgi:hypothetical protein